MKKAVVTIKIKKPRKGWSYHGGEVVDLPSGVAKEFVDEGCAMLVPDTDSVENPLPEDLPAREKLFAEGFMNCKSILEAQDALTDIDGIGDSTAARVVSFCESME